MKNFFAMLLAFAMLFSLFGCSFSEDLNGNEDEIVEDVDFNSADDVETVENPSDTTENIESGNVEEPESTEVTLTYLHASKSTGDTYGQIFTWLPKNKNSKTVDTEIETWPLHDGKANYTAFYIYNAVPQLKDTSEDAVRINAEVSDFMNSLGKDSSLYSYISGFRYGIVTVLADDRSAVAEPDWYNFAYDSPTTHSQVNMKDYISNRGVSADDVLSAVEEIAYLLGFTDVPDGVTAEIRCEFNGDYCVMLTDSNTALLRYAVVYTSDSGEVIPYNSGWITFDLEPINCIVMDSFDDLFTWFTTDYPWEKTAELKGENFLDVSGCLPLLKSDSEVAKKLNAQMVYYQYGWICSEVYRASNGFVYVQATYETTCYGIDHPTYVYDTVNEKEVSVYDLLVSLDFDFEGLYDAVAEANSYLFTDGMGYDPAFVEYKFDIEDGDWSISFIDEDTVLVNYDIYYNGDYFDRSPYIVFDF